MSTDPQKIKDVFLQAVEQCEPGNWDDFLASACEGDAELRHRVEVLLNAHLGEDSLFDYQDGAVTPTDIRPITEQPGDTIGPYKLLQQIGEGGMGTVFMAEQTEPVERRVALKIIKPGMDTQQVIARFEAEQQALAMMDHPNIAKVLDAGTTETGRPYFVMELVKGIPITKYCDEEHLTPKERLELFIAICQAVQHAHQKGIIHRDLKPSNILVAQYDGKPAPKVIDFGVAKAIRQKLTEKTMFTQYGQIVGTLEYMSPEQARFNQLDVDTRSDIYSLGVLLYELLTGETPFDKQRLRSAAFDELLRIIREEEPPKPSTKLSGSESLANTAVNRKMEPKKLSLLVRGDLDWIVMKALEKDRNRRYETATSFANDIQHYLNDEPVAACPPSAVYKFRKFARRNKVVIGTTSTIAASLIGGIIGTSWQAYRATKAEGQAWQEALRATNAEALANERLLIVQSQKTEITKEKQKAVAEAKRAEQESAIAKAVNEFLNDDLLGMGKAASQAEAGLSPDPNIKLRTLLDRAAQNIEDRFSDLPLVEAAIRHTLGATYHEIGAYEEAEKQLQRALELRRQQLGNENSSTLTAMNSLANLHDDQGRYSEAEKLHRQTLEIRRRTLGNEHADTIGSINNLANTHWNLGRYKEAELLHKEALNVFRKTHGTEHKSSLSSMSNLANVYLYQGRYEQAEQLYRRALEVRRSVLGDKHPDTLDTLHNLAYANKCQGNYSNAEKLYLEVLNTERQLLGDEHPDTLRTMNSLANVYNDLGRNSEAEQLHQKTLEISRRTLGAEHPQTLYSIVNLAIVYRIQHRFAEADMLLHQAMEIQRRTLGHEHPDTLTTNYSLVRLYIDQGHLAEAESLCHQTLEARRRVLGDEHPHTLDCMNLLAIILGREQRFQEAEQVYQKVLAILQRTQSEDFPLTKMVKSNFAGLFGSRAWALAASPKLEERNPSEAVRLAQQAVDLEPDNANNWENLGVALCSNQEYERAVEALEKAREMRGGNDGYHRIFLATAYSKVGRTDEALAEYLQNANWLERNRQRAEQYRFRDEAEEIIGLDQLTEYFSRQLQQGPFDLETARLYVDLLLRHQRIADAVQFCQRSLENVGLSAEQRKAACQEIAKVDELFAPLTELLPDDRQLWLARGDYLARTNQWAGAAEAYGRIKLSESQAAALLLSGDEEEYRTLCNEQITALQQAAIQSPGFCRMVAEICSYSGAVDYDRQQLLEWAQRAADENPSKFTLHTLGCALYRTGEFARAAEVFELANARPDAVKSNNAFPLALTHHQLGNSAEAQRWYDDGLQEMKRARPNKLSVAGWAPGHWMSVNVWHCEAAKIIGELPLIAPRPEAVDETSRPQVAETEEATTVPTTIGQKE